MAEEYQKISPTEFKVTKTITETKEEIYSIQSLLQKKVYLLEQIQRQKEELGRQIEEAKKELEKIESLIEKAKELGIEDIGEIEEGK